MEKQLLPTASYILILLIFIVSVLSGCNSDDSDETEIKGKIISSIYHSNTVVWADINGDDILSQDEPSTVSDSEGKFFLVLDKNCSKDNNNDQNYIRLIADTPFPDDLYSGESDNSENKTLYHRMRVVLNDPYELPCNKTVIISPFSTLADYKMRTDETFTTEDAQKFVAAEFNISASAIFEDYVAQSDHHSRHLANMILYTQLFYSKSLDYIQSLSTIADDASKAVLEHAEKLTFHAGQLASKNSVSMQNITKSNSSTNSAFLKPPEKSYSSYSLYGDLLTRTISSQWDNTLEYGRGYNSLKDSPVSGSMCVSLNESAQKTSLCSENLDYEFSIVANENELLEKMNVGARASLDLMIATVRGEINFAKTAMEKSNKIYIVMSNNSGKCSYFYDASAFSLTEDAKTLYNQDYQQFIETCGDSFLADIRSGGKFIGVFQLDYYSEDEKEDLEIKLKADVLFTTVSRSWQDKVDTLIEEMNARYVIYSNTGNVINDYASSKDDFFNYYQQFLDHINSSDCSLENGEEKCRYMAYYYDYGTINTSYLSNLQGALDALDEYNDYAASYDDIDRTLDYISSYSYLFPFFELDYIDSARNIIMTSKSIIKQYAVDCESNSNKCTPLEDIGQLDSPEDIREKFKIPSLYLVPFQTCKELADENQLITDGTFTLYADRNIDEPFSAHCINMQSDNPLTFLDFIHHHFKTNIINTNLVYNFATAQGLSIYNDENSETFCDITEDNHEYPYIMVSVYDKIPIEPCSNKGECFYLRYDMAEAQPLDTKITYHNETSEECNFKDEYDNPVSFVPYGTLYLSSKTTGTNVAKLNMNLTDMPFVFANKPYSTDAYYASTFTISNDNKVFDLHLNKAGSVYPESDITIEYQVP